MIHGARLGWLLAALGALVFGAASLWKITEQDIFWQIRAGDELLRGLGFPDGDTWSFTGKGREWLNVQWLSTILIRLAHLAGGDRALILFRGATLAGLLLLLAASASRALRSEGTRDGAPEGDPGAGGAEIASRGTRVSAIAVGLTPFPSAILLLFPLFFLGAAFRVQMRSDLFVFVAFAGTCLTWLSGLAPARKALASVGWIILAANLHHGTAPFVAAAAAAFLVSSAGWSPWAWKWLAVFAVAFFVTPYGPRVLPFLQTHFFYYKYNVMANPDHQPLRWRHLLPSEFSYGGLGWLAIMVLAWIAWWRGKQGRIRLPLAYSDWRISGAVLGALTLMSQNRIRTFPYAMIYAFPLAACAVRGWLDGSLLGGAGSTAAKDADWRAWLDRDRRAWILAGAAAALWLGAFPHHLKLYRIPIGFGLADRTYPVGTTRFLAEAKPEPRLFSTYAYGNYLSWNLREYLLFADTRETMYRHLQQPILDAYLDAGAANRIYDEYGINAVLVPIPKTRYISGLGFEDVIEAFCPREKWGIAYFDLISVAVLRRTPKNREILARHEYRYLRPNLPPNHYVYSKARTPERDAAFARELAFCREREPEVPHCLIAEAAWIRDRDGDKALPRARELLEKARVADSGNLTLLVELQKIYQAQGDFLRASEIERSLDRMGPSMDTAKQE